jgi:hypothetical protein
LRFGTRDGERSLSPSEQVERIRSVVNATAFGTRRPVGANVTIVTCRTIAP